MGESNPIPVFKKKEVNIDYLSGFEDEEYQQIKMLWAAIMEYDVRLTLNQVSSLLIYREHLFKYASQLVFLLNEKDDEFFERLTSDIVKFSEFFSPNSRAEHLILNILKRVCSEIYWINDILHMERYEEDEEDEEGDE